MRADYRDAPAPSNRAGRASGSAGLGESIERAILIGFPPGHPTLMATASKAKKKTVRIASGRKRARQDVKLNAANTALRSKFRTAVKGVLKAVATGDKAKAGDTFKAAQRVIDSIADKGIFHKNKAARLKSRLSAKVKALAAPAAA
jgi:small subunit ribosomal protein S20